MLFRSEEEVRVELTEESFALVMEGRRRGLGGFTMRLEPWRSPRAFTWSAGGRTRFVGSYRLRHGELTMILRTGDRLDARPTDFDGEPEFRIVLRRSGR